MISMIELDNIFHTIMIIIFLSSLVIYIFNKNNILIDQVIYSKHKNLTGSLLKSPPLCGGILIFIYSVLFFQQLVLLKIFSSLILVLGILSDTNKISSPTKRILTQSIISICFIILSDLTITNLRIDFLNFFLDIKFVSILFTLFCVLILINGSNFLDGLNTLVIGYYILVCLFLIMISNNFELTIDPNIKLLIIILSTLFFFNFFGKLYLGDSGAYLLGFYIAFFVIDFSLKNNSVSPFFICFLLWYPAFENLFSIIRRIIFKNKVAVADQLHLHQMIYNFFTKKNLVKNIYSNTLVANLINIYNLIIFACFYKFYSSTKILILGIFFNIIVYISLYLLFKKKLIES
jgi:UDP-N-acetylmuramyl pentapeptide phosphotransferase/UDP-N-acetylglucosamine-1-phosphate transferase